jgi:hypothetical protein
VPSNGTEQRADLMTLSIGSVSTATHQFSDIREITEMAAEDRRSRNGVGSSDSDNTQSLLTSW